MIKIRGGGLHGLDESTWNDPTVTERYSAAGSFHNGQQFNHI